MSWTIIIRTEEQYKKALDRFEEIFHKTTLKKYNDEFDLLSLLITTYENENYSIDSSDPIKLIKMKYLDLKPQDIGHAFGTKITMNKIFNYEIGLTLQQIRILSSVLGLSINQLGQPYKLKKKISTSVSLSNRKRVLVNA